MTRMFTKIVALAWLVMAIVALTRDSKSPSEPPHATIGADSRGARRLAGGK